MKMTMIITTNQKILINNKITIIIIEIKVIRVSHNRGKSSKKRNVAKRGRGI